MRVELRAARIPVIGAFAHHHWFVIEASTVGDERARERWEVWQWADAGGVSWGHVHRDLLPPDAGVGSGPSWLVASWEGEVARRLAERIRATPERYPFCKRYRYWPGPNSNTYVQWVLRDCFTLGRCGIGRRYGRGRRRARIAGAPSAREKEPTMDLTIVDVFAEARYQGNQLAVVRGCGGLAAAQMQAIAREMNFSETTFVIDEQPGRARVRIFTPATELPFAGHPTLGTAWVLAGGEGAITLALASGDVPVRCNDGLVWMTPPAAEQGPAIARADAAALVGLEVDDLDRDLEPMMVRCGPSFVLVPLRSLAALQRLRVDVAVQRDLALEGYPFAVCRGGYSADADFAARMLFDDGVALREDPATGSACAALASYLRARGWRGAFIVEQGFEIQRPSRIHLEIGDTLAVGGRVQHVAEGRLLG